MGPMGWYIRCEHLRYGGAVLHVIDTMLNLTALFVIAWGIWILIELFKELLEGLDK
jgi:hypothetical protein